MSESTAGSSLKEVFTFIFKENRWGNDESVSGAGSALSSPSVRDSIEALDQIIRHFNIRFINDVPCGDFYWIPLILGRFPEVEYRGFDIVPDLIDLNAERYPARDFGVIDGTTEILPHADLIFCKDLLLHLYHKDICLLLRNFKRSNSRYLLISSNRDSENRELVVNEAGACRNVNLSAQPYNFPPPLWSTNYLSLWSLDAIEESFFDKLCANSH